jgi:hypothetical protein
MEARMRKSVGIATAVALTIATIAAWTNTSIRTDAALKMLGPMATDAQVDTTELTKTTRNLPAQTFDAF